MNIIFGGKLQNVQQNELHIKTLHVLYKCQVSLYRQPLIYITQFPNPKYKIGGSNDTGHVNC